MKPLSGYVRVSSVAGREGERFQSPTAQREAIQRWATYRDITPGEIHEDLDRSGGTLQRPGLQAILEAVERGDSGGIVVAKLDRLSRSVQDGLAVIEQIERMGGQVVSCADNIDTTSANGKLQLTMFLGIAQWYRDTAKETWAASKGRAMERGALPGRTLYGTRRLEDGRVELDPERAAAVAWMVTERASGKGWKAIATGLNRDGIPTPRGNAQWAASTVQSIVASEGCLGVFTGSGERLEGAWPAMVARSTWDAAQLVRGKRDGERRYDDRLLAGIARCASCRRTLRRTTNQQAHVSYGCVNRACPGRSSIGAAALDAYVATLIDGRLAELRLDAHEATDEVYDALRTAADEAAAEMERWRDDAEMRMVIGDADYRAGLVARAQARNEAASNLASHLRQSRHGVTLPNTLPSDVTVALADLEWADRRRVADAYLHAVFVRRSARRGPHAARDLDARVRVVWADDRERPDLPSAVSGDMPPV